MSTKMFGFCKYFVNSNGVIFRFRNIYNKVELGSLNLTNIINYDLHSRKFSTEVKSVPSEIHSNIKNQNNWERESEILEEEKNSIIGPVEEDISYIGPYFQPSFNFAAYVNKSKTLQELVKLGVDLHKLEQKKDVPTFLLQMDFETNIKEYIMFLHDLGVPADELGLYFTKNPFIFKEDLDNLQVRVNYLQSKKFTNKMITRVISKNPFWLSFSTKDIDRRLGHFQKTFKLTGAEVRSLTTKQPRLITYSLMLINGNTFSIKEEMGFTDDEMKYLLLKSPRLWMKCNKVLVSTFDYVHNVMKIPHQQILDFPEILRSRTFRIKQRHKFLQSLGRAQYNPKLEGYISPQSLVNGTDTEFCQSVARSSVEAFNIFLKSI